VLQAQLAAANATIASQEQGLQSLLKQLRAVIAAKQPSHQFGAGAGAGPAPPAFGHK